MSVPKQQIILDACVLIDYCQEDSTLLSLASKSVGKVVVLTPILAEVDQLSEIDCERLGLLIVEPEIDVLIKAGVPIPGLALRDRICLMFAKDYLATTALYTNDKRLRKTALAAGVTAKWGLEILIELVRVGQLTSADAIIAAQNICKRSHFSANLLIKKFKDQLAKQLKES